MYDLIAILSFIFILAAFLVYFLRKEDKRVLLGLFLEVLSSSYYSTSGKRWIVADNYR